MEKFEKPENLKSEHPAGRGRELNEVFRDNILPFEQVKNKVVFVNEEVLSPLKLEEGKPSPAGLFGFYSPEEEQLRKVKNESLEEFYPDKQKLEVWPGHKRTALLGRLIFKDKQNRFYCDIDLKGMGHITEDDTGKLQIEHPSRYMHEDGETMIWGLLDKEDAFWDYQMSEKFLKAGIRTHRVLSIINLEEIIVYGQKISLAEAKKKEITYDGFQPVIAVRAFGTKARIDDVLRSRSSEMTSGKFLEDAKKLVSQELGQGDKSLSDEEYLEWFSKTLGRNIGLMHKNGWCHGWLTDHNITLDCRITDLDTVWESRKEDDRKEDIIKAERTLFSLAKQFHLSEKKVITATFFNEQFHKSYNAVFFEEQEQKKPKIN